MIQARCIQKFRSGSNIIIGYRLIDLVGQTLDIESEDLKRAIYRKQINVINLTLTSDGKLIDTSEDDSIFNINTINIIGSKLQKVAIEPIKKNSRSRAKGEMTLGEKCKVAGVPISNVSYYKSKNNCSDEEAIQLAMNAIKLKKQQKEQGVLTLREKCRRAGVDEKSAAVYRERYSFTDDEAIQYAIEVKQRQLNKKITLSEKCRQANANYAIANSFRIRTNCSDEEAIQYAINQQQKNEVELANKYS